MKNCFIWWNLYKLRNLRLQTWLNQNTYLFVLLFIAVWIARYQLLNLFFASHQSGRLYTMIDHWRCLVFFLVNFISTHSGQFFTLPTYQSYLTLLHKYWNQFKNWIASWIKQKCINLNVGKYAKFNNQKVPFAYHFIREFE